MEHADMTVIQVHKLDAEGVLVLTYEAEVMERLVDGIQLAARWARPSMDLGYVTFETGDCFTEWFYRDRWYNIFEIASPDGTLKGWYCNIAAPADIDVGQLFCRDLLLDLWVTPDGATTVLDEEEFAAELALDDAVRDQALAGLAELQRLVANREGPFSRLQRS
jgi:predicted RNA-binding protein associated with RNAse of E/G family